MHNEGNRSLRVVVFAGLASRDQAGSGNGLRTPNHEAQRRLEEDVFRRPVSHERGHIVDTNGLGVVAVFTSCSDALRACLTMHKRLGRTESESLATLDRSVNSRFAPRQELRIGVSVGDISFDSGDIFGPAVVEAARLEGLCRPDEILASEAVGRLATLPPELELLSAEEYSLKGFEGKTSAWRFHRIDHHPSILGLPTEVDPDCRYPLIGMDKVMAETQASWDLAQSGHSQVLLLEGNQGAGKSRIASELAKQAYAEGATVLFGSCQPELAIPYHPFAAALHRARHLDSELQLGFDHGAGPLAALRAVTQHPPTAHYSRSPNEGQAGEKQRLFDEVVGVVRRISVSAPLLIVLDDLHWATSATIDLLNHVSTELGSSNVLIIGTVRPDEIEVMRDGKAEPLSIARTLNPSHRLVLSSFGWEHIGSLLSPQSSALTPELEQVARHIEVTTGGNPLFVEETLAHLKQTGAIRQVGEQWIPQVPVEQLTLPSSILQMATERVSRLSPKVSALLAVAALGGEVFELEAVAAVAELSIDESIDQLELAETGGLVRESEQPGRYLFANALIPTAMRQTLRPTRRARLHQRMAEVLEVQWPDRVDELAHHWSEALGTKSAERTAHYLQLAGERDVESFAWTSAIARFKQVVQLLDDLPRTEDTQQRLATAWLALGLAQRASGDLVFREAITKAATIARHTGQANLLARAATGMMRPGYWNTGAGLVDQEIVDLCEDALIVLDDQDPMRVRVLTALATTLLAEPDASRRTNCLREAQDLAEVLGDEYLIGLGLVAEMFALNAPNQREQRAKVSARLASIGRAIGSPDFQFVAGLFQAVAGLEVGDISATEAKLASIESAMSEVQNYWYESLVITLRTTLDIMRCLPNMAAVVDANMGRFIDTPHDTEGVWTIQHGQLAYQAGTLGTLLSSLESVADSAGELPWETGLALGHLQIGDFDAAAKVFLYEREFDDYWLAAMDAKATVAFWVGDSGACQELFDTLLPYRGRVAFVSRGSTIAGPISTSLGQVAYVIGELMLAEELLREGLALAEQMGAIFLVAEATYCLGLVLLATDESSDEGESLIQEVVGLSNLYGFGFYEKHAMDLIAQLGRDGN